MNRGFKAEALATYIAGNAGVPLRFSRPVDKAQLIMVGVTLGSVISAGYAGRHHLQAIFSHTFIWSTTSIVRPRLMVLPGQSARRIETDGRANKLLVSTMRCSSSSS